ncbi:MAG: BamA/TamA family outer membrane protein [Bacteroidales bacterium]
MKRKFNRGYVFFMLMLATVFLSSCSVTRKFEEGEYLLKKNKIQLLSDEPGNNFTASELERYYRQKPNKKFLRVYPFHAVAYNFGEGINIPDTSGYSGWRKWWWNRKNRFRTWVMKNGEAPVVLDTAAADRTLVQFESFLFTRGHFKAEAERVITYPQPKRARVTYIVYPGPGHKIRNFSVEIPSDGVRELYQKDADASLIKSGANYDEKVFQQERDRITRVLKDSGFYHFNKAYILLEVDTFVPGNLLDVHMKIQDQSFYDEEDLEIVVTRPHLRSRIGRIFINPEYEGIFIDKEYQVIPVEAVGRKKREKSVYYLYTAGEMDYNPQMLIRNVLLEPGQLYSLRDVELTYLYLSDLSNFGNISITFKDADAPPGMEDTTVLWLDCTINMSRVQKQLYEVRMDVTNRAGDPGLSTNLVYQNRNLFGGAQVLSLALKGALEVQKILDKEQDESTIIDKLPFNTVELGVDADIRIPGLVAPIPITALPKTFKPRTRFSGGVNFQERPDYKRYITKISTGYEWQTRPNVAMAFNPFELNAVSINPDQSFIEKINALNDQRLKNSYSDHIITALTWSVVIDNQGLRTRGRYSFIRFNIESAGFLVNAFRNPLNYAVNAEGIAMIFNIPYSQYLRTDLDYRRFYHLKKKDHVVAGRVYVGLGNPYGNMDVLPFEKSFYVGGGNGIRAWPVRSIGPGSFSDVNNLIRFDRTGDMGFESSIEYRFPLYGTFHGALFLDGGNVWLKNANDKYPGGELVAKDFFRELALGTGFGIRIVSFFVIRVDAGIKLHDPSKPDGERWMLDQIKIKRINWNFGIGYSI